MTKHRHKDVNNFFCMLRGKGCLSITEGMPHRPAELPAVTGTRHTDLLRVAASSHLWPLCIGNVAPMTKGLNLFYLTKKLHVVTTMVLDGTDAGV